MKLKTLTLKEIHSTQYNYEYKFLLPESQLSTLIKNLQSQYLALQINNQTEINYQSWYYDDELWSVSRGKYWQRFFNKLRLRKYGDEKMYFLEAKTVIDNQRQKTSLGQFTSQPKNLKLSDIFKSFSAKSSLLSSSKFFPRYQTRYNRQSWFNNSLDCKITIDKDFQALRIGEAKTTSLHGQIIVEIKTKLPLTQTPTALEIVENLDYLQRLGSGKFSIGMSLK
jgi:hypothetical protein